jgi:hypothetical protein
MIISLFVIGILSLKKRLPESKPNHQLFKPEPFRLIEIAQSHNTQLLYPYDHRRNIYVSIKINVLRSI